MIWKIAVPLIFTVLASGTAKAVSACTPGRIEALGLAKDACSHSGTSADALVVVIAPFAVLAVFMLVTAWITRPPRH